VSPVQNGSLYTFQAGSVALEVNAAVGGRITAFSFGGKNLFTTAAVDSVNYGSTLWLAPQTVWDWPPPASVDTSPYTAAVVDGSVLRLQSPATPYGTVLQKTLSVSSEGNVTLDYQLLWTADSVPLAAWEVTRVPRGGLAFFPTGTGAPVKAEIPVTQAATVTWCDTAQAASDGKYAADAGAGWLAYAASGYLFVKSFADTPPNVRAAGHGEIEVYVNATKGYTELEVQGAVAKLSPQTSAGLRVKWRVAAIPAGTAVAPGSEALITLAQSLAAP
jgi:hypothetical protein